MGIADGASMPPAPHFNQGGKKWLIRKAAKAAQRKKAEKNKHKELKEKENYYYDMVDMAINICNRSSGYSHIQ